MQAQSSTQRYLEPNFLFKFSILDHSPNNGRKGKSKHNSLIGPDGGRIKTFGKKTMRLEFEENKIYEHEFMIAEIELPILGVDFLFNFNFSIDFKKRLLIEI